MKPFLQVGIIAFGLQLVGVAILTLVTFSFFANGASTQVLTWMYLTIAAGLALTTNRYVRLMTGFVRRVSRFLNRTQPIHVSTSLTVQLVLSALLFAMLALQPPPHFMNDVGNNLGFIHAASIMWSGSMSAAAAGFGATAHAAYRALDESRV
jgi:hypothetical protein